MGEDATEEKEEESDCKLGIGELYSSILFSRLYIFRLINEIGFTYMITVHSDIYVGSRNNIDYTYVE